MTVLSWQLIASAIAVKIHGTGSCKIQMVSEPAMIETKKLLTQFTKYFGVALVGYIFDLGLLILLHELFSFHYLVAASISFVVGLVVVYLLSNRYVFGESKISSKTGEFSLFALIGLIGLIILNILMWFFSDILAVNYIASKIIATVFVYSWNFFARRSLYHD